MTLLGHTLIKNPTMNPIRFVLLASLGVGAGLGPVAADEKWVLWERQLDTKGEQLGDWRRRRVFDGERWCKGAMTTAINQALTQTIQVPRKPSLAEYQCLPESADPRTAKGKGK